MRSHEALKKAIKGGTVEFARRLGLSTGMVNKWQEPSADETDSGAYNPLDRIEVIIQTSLDLGTDRDDAFAPLYYLNKRFGLNATPEEAPHDVEDLSRELVETIREMGHLTTVASEALAAREISAVNVRRIEEEGNHLIRRVLGFMKKTKDLAHRRFTLFGRRKEKRSATNEQR